MKIVIATMGGKEQGWSRYNEVGIFRDYQAEAKRLELSALRYGYYCKIFDNEFIDKRRYRRSHSEVLDKVSFGFAYKAICFWSALSEIDDGDFLMLIDSNHVVAQPVDRLIHHTLRSDVFVWNHASNSVEGQRELMNRFLTKKATFRLMDCDEEVYWDTPQLQANVIGAIKNNTSLRFAREFLSYSLNPNVMFGLPDETQVTGFRFHRHDQSILTNLVIKHRLIVFDRPSCPWADQILPELSPIRSKGPSGNEAFRSRDLPHLA
jgi:hypothetical protein